QCLIGMAGEHYMIKGFTLAMHEFNHRLTSTAMNAVNAAIQAHSTLEFITDPLYILATSPGYRTPLGSILELYQTVILTETKKGNRRVVQHL
ncbi:hypothetical protein Q6294_29890, partial [Klebsiella pneumoniae]